MTRLADSAILAVWERADHEDAVTRALRLPTFEVAGMELIRRLTLVLRDGQVEHVRYPVFPPDGDASDVAEWLRRHPE